MSARFVLAAVAAFAASSLLAVPSRADVPPQSYPETCDVESSSAVAGPCLPCEADYLEPRACERSLSPKGLRRHCRASGVLQWTEVWCGPAAAQAPPSPSAAPPPVSVAASASVAPFPPRAPDAPSPRPSSCAACASSEARPSPAWLLVGACALALRALRASRSARRTR